MSHHRFIVGNVLDALKTLPDESVHCCITSPPYFGLRDYELPPVVWPEVEYSPMPGLPSIKIPAWEGQLGLEPTPEMYVAHLVLIFREVKRVLRKDGTLWLNLGDSYMGSWGNYHPYSPPGKHGQRLKETARWNRKAYDGKENFLPPTARPSGGLKKKDLIGIPWRVAFALQADGWWLRCDVIWNKRNCLPESAKDRPTRNHDYVFLFARAERYCFDPVAVAEPVAISSLARINQPTFFFQRRGEKDYRNSTNPNRSACKVLGNFARSGSVARNRRSVWEINIEPFPDPHFATFPKKLAETCILAGTSEKGCCPVCGAPWRRVVRRVRTLDGGPVELGGWPVDEGRRLGPQGVGHWRFATIAKTLGWEPSCNCTATDDLVAAWRKACGADSRGSYSGKAMKDYSSARAQDPSEVKRRIHEGMPLRATARWEATCACGAPPGVEPGDLDVVETPTGKKAEEDPSLFTGRAGFNRPRNPNEGTRPITRYEQRKYAEQLRSSPHRREMEAKAGSAFEHYVRTDPSGARPVPPDLLEKWIERGWLERVEVPAWTPPDPVPCVVLDPFGGAGTTTLVAASLGRDSIYIDLKREYVEMALKRCGFTKDKLFDQHTWEVLELETEISKATEKTS